MGKRKISSKHFELPKDENMVKIAHHLADECVKSDFKVRYRIDGLLYRQTQELVSSLILNENHTIFIGVIDGVKQIVLEKQEKY